MAGDEYEWKVKSWLLQISDPFVTFSACLHEWHARGGTVLGRKTRPWKSAHLQGPVVSC